jgi:hypothetical protein
LEVDLKNRIFSIIIICFFLTSCALIFKGTKQEVNFGSDPQRADVYVNGAKLGETPFAIELVTKNTYTIEFRKEGYESKTVLINNKIGAGWVILDILLGLVPVVVDAATGAWYSLDQKNVNAILEKQQNKPIDKKDLSHFMFQYQN